jgi:glycosyltransferase involved in cell wall biosynthesis
MSSSTLDVSVIIPTYNRAAGVRRAIQSVLFQTAPPDSYEILVVDNNSTDGTADVIDALSREHPGRLRRILETRQGVAYARQAGIDAAGASVLAFFDDDVYVSPDWIETITRTFRERKDIEVVGGKVLPEWTTPPPRWLTRAHWSPLALQDFGDRPELMSIENPRALISANLACRHEVFSRLGGFSPHLQRVKDGIGSLEDDEWIRRLWKSGGRGLYVPELVAYTEVPESRLTPSYHRRWHQGHGRFYALMRADEMERSSIGSLFGVPAHMYRAALNDVVGLMTSVVTGRSDRAFLHEVKLRFFTGFCGQRFVERRYP